MVNSQSQLLDKLRKAVFHRQSLLQQGEPLRLFHREFDGQAGLWIDCFGEALVVHVEEQFDFLHSQLRAIKGEIRDLTGVEHIYVRINRRRRQEVKADEVFLLTEAAGPNEEFIINEKGLRYVIRPRSQVNGGFFIDARDLRQLVRLHAMNARVLNTFAFTGSIGLSAAIGGALEVTQVDISRGILRWARENQKLNDGLCLRSQMKFIEEDSRTFLAREERRIQQGKIPYDIVVLDPPTFGSSGKKPFRLVSEYQDLLSSGLRVLGEGGHLFFTCNCTRIAVDDLKRAAQEAAMRLNWQIDIFNPIYPPRIDFGSFQKGHPSLRGIHLAVSKNKT